VPLPPKCPELNPQENVWQFMRDNWLSNRVFKSYDDLVDHCCDAWNNSLTSHAALCPSVCAIGHTGSDQWEVVFALLDGSPLLAWMAVELVAGARRHGDGLQPHLARWVFSPAAS
jgi:hypothetical protein